MAPTLPQFNPARLRSYIFRVPLFTRIILLLIILFWILEFQTAWDITQWGALVPLEVNLGTSMSTVAHMKRPTHEDGLERREFSSIKQADLMIFPSVPAEYISFDSLRLLSCPSKYPGACSTPRKI